MSHEVMREMPRYRSHKEVWALQVASVEKADPGSYRVKVRDPGFADVVLSAEVFARGEPQEGDYIVQYGDGYWSWSPKKPFEDGYDRV